MSQHLWWILGFAVIVLAWEVRRFMKIRQKRRRVQARLNQLFGALPDPRERP